MCWRTQKIVKFASVGDKADSIELVRQRSTSQEGHTIGIAHTRWATHGRKSDNNAHPHVDSTGKIVVVHNGTIDNANLLRQELQEKGHQFTSETDTEVIAKLIGDIYYQSKENSERGLLKAVEAAMSRCTGSWVRYYKKKEIFVGRSIEATIDIPSHMTINYIS